MEGLGLGTCLRHIGNMPLIPGAAKKLKVEKSRSVLSISDGIEPSFYPEKVQSERQVAEYPTTYHQNPSVDWRGFLVMSGAKICYSSGCCWIAQPQGKPGE